MIITVHIATCINHTDKIGGLSYYALSDDKNYKGFQKFKDPIDNTVRANVMALSVFFYYLKRSSLANVQQIILEVDCKVTHDIFKFSKQVEDIATMEAAQFCNGLIFSLRAKYHIRPRRFRNTPFISWRIPDSGNRAIKWCRAKAAEAMYQGVQEKFVVEDKEKFNETMSIGEILTRLQPQ